MAFKLPAIAVDLGKAIELTFPGARFGKTIGRAADGRGVSVDLRPAPEATSALDIGILFDRSSSTSDSAGDGYTVWQTMREGLRAALSQLGQLDRAAIFEFANDCKYIGAANGPETAKFVERILPPDGGTELGLAIDELLATGIKDILVLTDGQTWRSEAHRLAGSGARITAVLVGPGSFEPTIGHLAAITGGQAFAVSGAQTSPAIDRALASMRGPSGALRGSLRAGKSCTLETTRSGCMISANWSDEVGELQPDAVGRYAAALTLPLLPEKDAAVFATAHGLCTHLTSLVLVDEQGLQTVGLPETRKIALVERAVFLAAPRLAMAHDGASVMARRAASFAPPIGSTSVKAQPNFCGLPDQLSEPTSEGAEQAAIQSARATASRDWTSAAAPFDVQPQRRARNKRLSIAEVASAIDWDVEGNRLLTGDLSGLQGEIRSWIEAFERNLRIRMTAFALRSSVRAVAVGLIARKAKNRTADRLARRLFGSGRRIS